MEKNEIKKILYKEKPKAWMWTRNRLNNTKYYKAHTSIGIVRFEVPGNEQKGTDFHEYMDAQLLIRWLVDPNI